MDATHEGPSIIIYVKAEHDKDSLDSFHTQSTLELCGALSFKQLSSECGFQSCASHLGRTLPVSTGQVHNTLVHLNTCRK